jgi:hypothetical protein
VLTAKRAKEQKENLNLNDRKKVISIARINDKKLFALLCKRF